MKQTIIKITEWLALLLSWLTISPLFVYLSSRWKLIGKKMRILLLLVSPLMVIVYFIILLLALQGYYNYQRKYHFADNEVIERITGVAFPELDIVDYIKWDTGFSGDYNDVITLEMKDDLDESTYNYLDSIIDSGDTSWSKHGNEYSYSIMWGNGLPAPKGESKDDDIMFSLSFERGSKIINLKSGSW